MAPNSNQRPRLGRGLSSLIVNTAPPAEPVEAAPPASRDAGAYVSEAQPDTGSKTPIRIPVGKISPNPYQPRKTIDPDSLSQLTESIRQQGILQPILVAPNTTGDDYILIAGQRRLAAAKEAGLENVPVMVREASDEQILEWAIVENIQRADLNAVERATAYRDVIDRFKLTQAQLAERLGTSRESIANYLRILDLCDGVQDLLLADKLSFGHARALAGLSGKPQKQLSLARKVIDKQLSVRQLEALVAAAQSLDPAAAAPRARAAKSAYIVDLEQQLTQQLASRVTISPAKKANTGKLTIDYHSLDDFDRIVEALGVSISS